MSDCRLEAVVDGIDHVLSDQGLDPVGVVVVVLHVPEEAVAPKAPTLGPGPGKHPVRVVRLVLTPVETERLVMHEGA